MGNIFSRVLEGKSQLLFFFDHDFHGDLKAFFFPGAAAFLVQLMGISQTRQQSCWLCAGEKADRGDQAAAQEDVHSETSPKRGATATRLPGFGKKTLWEIALGWFGRFWPDLYTCGLKAMLWILSSIQVTFTQIDKSSSCHAMENWKSLGGGFGDPFVHEVCVSFVSEWKIMVNKFVELVKATAIYISHRK